MRAGHTVSARVPFLSRGASLRIVRRICVLVPALYLIALPAAYAADPNGVWLTKEGKARVRIADCGGALCGTIIWIRDPTDPATGRARTDVNNADPALRQRPLVGLRVVSGMRASGTPDKWVGSVYSVERGKTYSGSLVLQGPTRLKVEGCNMVLCGGETWTRESAGDTRRPAQRAR